MSGTRHLFDLHRNNEVELVGKIKEIAHGLDYLTRLIAHGESVAPGSKQDLQAYSVFVSEQLEHLTQLVKSVETGADRAHISDQVNQFHESCQSVLAQLGVMKALPTLEAEQAALNAYMKDFDTLGEQVSQNLSSADLLTCLKTSRGLLEGINGSITAALENPLVQIARCATEGAVVTETLSVPSTRPQL